MEDVVPEVVTNEAANTPAAELPQAKAKWHRWRPHAHVPHRWRPVRRIPQRAIRHVGLDRAHATGGVIVSAVRRLGSHMKRLAGKLCNKVMTKPPKRTHKYVRRHTRHNTRFCIMT